MVRDDVVLPVREEYGIGKVVLVGIVRKDFSAQGAFVAPGLAISWTANPERGG